MRTAPVFQRTSPWFSLASSEQRPESFNEETRNTSPLESSSEMGESGAKPT